MKISNKIWFTLVIGMLSLALVAPVFAQEKMTMDEYNRELAAAQQREKAAKDDLAKCEAEIQDLKNQIASIEQQMMQVWDEIYAMLGTDKAGVDAYRSQLKALEAEVDGMMALSPEELFKRRAEIDQLQARLDEMKSSKISKLTEMQDMIATVEGKITQLRAKMPKAIYDQYTVIKGDYLWKISGKKDIYGDPYQWVRIYSYNSDLIKNPDLIYPAQIFKIQREVGPNEYLVQKGDFLAKIARTVMAGDPTKWMKIYEANKEVIDGIKGGSKHMLFPYTVLRLP
ncbi:MAG: LysM peptidoglycan-binding domain-containing protein [candidate division KSB1 bacterium]|nr:LysM peptidoglycan-binding domain-containing protein [candidate division KSB1 bacterium]MDZ7302917.1 LysM peptidoglycan-binding domain-containing protein [candidate division KSB1 bacterium]MDZ7310492.1 LysM peptidoglycan-binding domain-containing protein [candidate division KSB1 bacterium]